MRCQTKENGQRKLKMSIKSTLSAFPLQTMRSGVVEIASYVYTTTSIILFKLFTELQSTDWYEKVLNSHVGTHCQVAYSQFHIDHA